MTSKDIMKALRKLHDANGREWHCSMSLEWVLATRAEVRPQAELSWNFFASVARRAAKKET